MTEFCHVKRKPTLANRLSNWFSKRFNLKNPEDWKTFQGFAPTKSGVSVNHDTALTVSTIWACVMKRSNDFSSLPKGIIERRGESRILATRHDQYWLIKNQPHPHYTSRDWFKVMVIMHDLYGACYAKIVRNEASGRPMQYDIIHSAYMQPFWADDEKTDLWWKNWKTGELLPDADVFRVAYFSLDPFSVKSPVTVFRESIGMSIAQVEAASQLFTNNFRSDGWIKRVETLKTQDAFDTASRNWDERMSSWQTPVLDNAGEFHEFGMPLTDAQFIENRKFQVEELCRIFGMDPTQIGHVDAGRATGVNEEEKSRRYVQNVLLPLATAFEQEFNVKSLRSTERKTHSMKVDLNGLLRGNLQARADYYQKAIAGGWMRPDEARSLEDESPLPTDQHGDQIRIPMNMVLGKDYDAWVISQINGNVKPTAEA